MSTYAFKLKNQGKKSKKKRALFAAGPPGPGGSGGLSYATDHDPFHLTLSNVTVFLPSSGQNYSGIICQICLFLFLTHLHQLLQVSLTGGLEISVCLRRSLTFTMRLPKSMRMRWRLCLRDSIQIQMMSSKILKYVIRLNILHFFAKFNFIKTESSKKLFKGTFTNPIFPRWP